MNGRVYDYNVGRFMSVDPFIVDPGNSQAINPYSYVMNNPLGYTDPTGYSANEVEVEVKTKARTGSRLGRTSTVKVSATSNSDGSATVSVSGGNGASRDAAKGAVKGAASSLGYDTADIGSPQAVAKQRVAGGGDFGQAPVFNESQGPKDDGSTASLAVGRIVHGGSIWGQASNGVGDEHTENIANGIEATLKELAGAYGSPSPGGDPDGNEKNQIRQPTTASSKVLRENLIKRGWEPQPGDAAHHLVAGRAKLAAPARQVLKRFKIDINAAENGVFLPHSTRISGRTYHRSIHTKTYYREVNNRLSQATNRGEALEILRGIRSDVTYGTFPF